MEATLDSGLRAGLVHGEPEGQEGRKGLAAAAPQWVRNLAADTRSKTRVLQEQARLSAAELSLAARSASGKAWRDLGELKSSRRAKVVGSALLFGLAWVALVSLAFGPLRPDTEVSLHIAPGIPGGSWLTDDPYDRASDVLGATDDALSREKGSGKFNPQVPRTPLLDLDKSVVFNPKKLHLLRQTRWPIRVAVFSGLYASIRSWRNIRRVLGCASNIFNVTLVKNANLSTLNRRNFDVFLMPGGEAGKMYEWHTKHGSNLRNTVRHFLKSGGGYVGFCAGAYLGRGAFQIAPFRKASSTLGVGWFSDVVLSDWFHNKHALFPIDNSTINDNRLYYANGPIFAELDKSKPWPAEVKNPRVIMRMGPRASVHIEHGPVPGTKAHTIRRRYSGLPVMTYNEFSNGKVLLSTGHPETDANGGIHSFEVKGTECDSNWANIIIDLVLMSANRTSLTSELEGKPMQ